MATSTLTILRTIEWAKRLNFGRRSALGNNLEPALTSANHVLRTIVGPPFAWRWNRVTTGFITAQGVQDYTLSSWQASSAFAADVFIVDPNGNSQQVTTAGTSGSTAPTWATSAGTTTDGTITWTWRGAIPTKTSTSFSYAWIEKASVYDTTVTKWFEMNKQVSLGLNSSQARPTLVSAFGDDGSGAITFRLMNTPSGSFPVALTLQQSAASYSSLNQTWSPIPDEFSYIFEWGFLSLMWLFADDPRWQAANQKFVTALLGANEGLSETDINIFLGNWAQVTGVRNQVDSGSKSQGVASRGV